MITKSMGDIMVLYPINTPLLGGWKGFTQVFIDNHTKSKLNFRGKHRKNDAELRYSLHLP